MAEPERIVLAVTMHDEKFFARVRPLPEALEGINDAVGYSALIMGLVYAVANRCAVPIDDIWEFLIEHRHDPPPFGEE